MDFKPEISFVTRIRKSPFFDSTIKWGAQGFTVYNKMYMPTFYRSYVDDYWSLVKEVTLWDVAGERQVEIKWNDAEKYCSRRYNFNSCSRTPSPYQREVNDVCSSFVASIWRLIFDDHHIKTVFPRWTSRKIYGVGTYFRRFSNSAPHLFCFITCDFEWCGKIYWWRYK